MTEPELKPLSEEEIIAWSREQYQKATAFLAEKGVIAETVSMENSRYLAPVLAVWKIKSTENKWFWVISGDLPTDFIAEEGAESVRDTLRAFSFRWQLKAENILTDKSVEQTQREFAAMLVGRADGLYDIFNKDELWQQ